jgi:type II secretion system protein H
MIPRNVKLRTCKGFTLIELMTVVTIMAVMMGLAFPLMKNLNEKNKLRAAAREVVALMKYARTEAVFGERDTEVFFDVKKRVFWLDLREPDPKTGEYNPKGKKKQLEQKRQLEQNISFDEITSYDSNILKNDIVAVDFYPDGTATPTLLTLMNVKGSRLTIEVLKSTGLAEVTPGTIEDKKQKELEEQQANPVVIPGTNAS